MQSLRNLAHLTTSAQQASYSQNRLLRAFVFWMSDRLHCTARAFFPPLQKKTLAVWKQKNRPTVGTNNTNCKLHGLGCTFTEGAKHQLRAILHQRQNCLFTQIFCHHQHFKVQMVCNKFWPKWTNLLTHRRQNFPGVKIWQSRLNKQNRGTLVNHLSYRIRQACNWTEVSLLERQKLSFAAKLRDSKVLKRLRINPGNWRWNPLATSWSY